MNATLTFDIETIPDVQGIRTLYELPSDIGDVDVVDFALQKRRAKSGTDFMPLHLHQVVAISCALRWGQDKLHISTIGAIEDDEENIIAKFFELVEKYTPQLVTWNGGGFDLPVLHYRAMIHGIAAPRYWDMGNGDYNDSRDFKWNNYISRYHTRHLDLMDLLALYQPRANVPLDELAKLCGFPGKLGMDGSKVWQAYHTGKLKDIRDYCETDAANTYLMFLRFELMRGNLTADEYQLEIKKTQLYLQEQPQAHWQAFCAAWNT